MDNCSAAGDADRLFRHAAGRMVARLMRLLGPRYLDVAEDAVQDAMCAALETWKFHGVPLNPQSWLMRAAHNRAVDLIRADRRFQNLLNKIALDPTTRPAANPSRVDCETPATHDDCLVLIFSCCDPRLAANAQLALILKAVCGFSLDEIAAAFFASPSTVEKRVTRAKAYLKRSRHCAISIIPARLSRALAPSTKRCISSLMRAINPCATRRRSALNFATKLSVWLNCSPPI
jgi:RNA polymerase sigma factor (sigma-70 family)